MKKYHYIDDQGNISDALPLAALQKIGLPPTTKVLVEGGKQWINLAEAMAGGPVVAPAPPLPPPPPPSVAAPAIAAKPPPFVQDLVAAVPFKGALAALNQPVVGAKGILKGVLKGCLFFVIGFPILIWVLAYLVDHGVGRAKMSDVGSGATRDNVTKRDNSKKAAPADALKQDDKQKVMQLLEGTYMHSTPTSVKGIRSEWYVSLTKDGKLFSWRYTPEDRVSVVGMAFKARADIFKESDYQLSRSDSGDWILSSSQISESVVHNGSLVSTKKFQNERISPGDFSLRGQEESYTVYQKRTSSVFTDKESVEKYHGCKFTL